MHHQFLAPGSGPGKNAAVALLNIAITAGAVALPGIAAAESSPPATNAQLEERIRILEQKLEIQSQEAQSKSDERIRVLERKLEIQTEEAVAKTKEAPVVVASEKGFGIKSADGQYELRFNGLLQVDSRDFFADDGTLRDGFILRRARPIFQGSLGKLISFRFTPEFNGQNQVGDGGAYTSILDAYIDLKFSPYASFRIGKQKGPVGLERLQSIDTVNVNELGFVTELVPNRDIGVTLFGAAFKNTFSYALGIYNGTADGRDDTVADDGQKEFAGRIFFEPFKNEYGFFRGLGFGVSGTTGVKDGTGNNELPRYRSPGAQQFFGYNADVQASGVQYRISPQAYFYHRNFGFLAEYALSAENVRRGNNFHEINNEAYNVTVSYALTGEEESYRGLSPSHPFALGHEGWGAFEIFGRNERLDVDNDVFIGTGATQLSNPNTNASKARSYGIGLNWHLNNTLKLTTDYNYTTFTGGRAGGQDRGDERALFTRVQIVY